MAAPTDNDPPQPDDATQILSGESEPEWPVAEQYRVAPSGTPVEAPPDASTVVVTGTPEEPVPERRRFPVDPVPGILLGIVAALLLIGLAAWLVSRDSGEEDDPVTAQTTTEPTTTTSPETTTTSPSTADVPDVTGVSLAEARTTLEDAGFRVRVTRRESARPPGEVLRQEPAAGTSVAPDAIVVLTVAREVAPSEIAVPEVTGLAVSEATEILRDAGLRAQIRLVPSNEPAGRVLEQSPGPGIDVAEDSVVRLDVAEARQPAVERVDVPDTVGTNVADARARLRDLGLRVRVLRVVAADPAGTVVRQSPQAGARVREGATVTLRVSTGPAEVTIPDVIGLDEATARSELEDAGFDVRVTEEPTSDPAQDGVVLAQAPAGGSTAREGAVATITVARFD